MKVMMMMNYGELKKGRIYEAIKLTMPGLYDINKYRIEDSRFIPACYETCKREGLKRDPICCMCDVKGDYVNWQWSVAKTKMPVETENQMPELKPGMVVGGKFKNDNGGKEEYRGILIECDNSLFVSYATVDGRLKYISDIKHDEIDKIYKMKRPSIFTAVLADDNLETIWDRKPPEDRLNECE